MAVASKPKGRVILREWRGGRGFALRCRYGGQRPYITLGMESEGWTYERAEEELQNTLADMRRGVWIPPSARRTSRPHDEPAEPEQPPAQLFGPFAVRITDQREGEVEPSTTRYHRWALAHLLPYFATRPLDAIDAEAVDDYRRSKVREAQRRRDAIDRRRPLTEGGRKLLPLSVSSINKTIAVLQSILAYAVEYGHTETNAAAGPRRRLKPEKKRPIYLDTVDQIIAVFDAAEELDHTATRAISDRLAAVTVLTLAGPRAEEFGNALWRDADLTNHRLHIGRSKTQAGLREIDMLPLLHQVLLAHKAASRYTAPDDPIFPTITGGRREKDNLRSRVLAPVLQRADELLLARDQLPLPQGVSPHKLRHTFASILVACGVDPASLMQQLGHTDPKFTLRVYTHMMRRNPDERARLKALVSCEQARHGQHAIAG